MAKHNDLGKWGEDLAAEYLQKQGYVIRDRDWHCGKRDIDLVAITADSTTVVFNVVEQVRFDVVTIVGNNSENAQLEHIEDAFNPLLA